MLISKLYRSAPRDYAIELIENGNADARNLLLSCLKFMSADDVRDMLDDNELSPRFLQGEENEHPEDEGWYVDEISSEERNACDHYNERYVTTYHD